VATGLEHLRFRCTGCGNCCRDPLLPLTDDDVRRIMKRTGDEAAELVQWVDRWGIDMDDEPEGFVMLRQGKRVMVLRHQRGRCRYLGADERCTIYSSRPLGCRVFPFDPEFSARGKLRRLRLVQAVECPYRLDGHNRITDLRALNTQYEAQQAAFHARVAEWNRVQRARRRKGQAAQTAVEFLAFLGLAPSRRACGSRLAATTTSLRPP
jgi:Fe-S-cluster containining protein